MDLPRGIRNDNPGNIRPGAPWQGATGDDGGQNGYLVFSDPVYGLRAIVRILNTYYTRYHLHSVSALIGRWAPPSDDNPTDEYVGFICKALGVGPDVEITLDSSTVKPFVDAIVRFENGDPTKYGRTEWYSDELVNSAIAMAYGA